MKKTFLFVLCLFLCTFFLQAQFNPELQKEFIIEISHPNPNLNPHTATYSIESQILNGLYEGLFICNPLTLEPEPGICESFKQSRDKKKWTFTLRDDAKFSNGKKITANEVKDSWIRLLSNPDAPYASLFDIIAGAKDFREGKTHSIDTVLINIIDDKTLTIRLNSPAEHLLNILTLSAFSIVPKEENVYSGPFTLEEKTENHISLVKNENYWDAANVALPSIRFIISLDEEEDTITHFYNMGFIHWSTGGVQIDKILDEDSIYFTTQFGTDYFFFKPLNKPWDNPKLRMALLSAIPWEEFQKNSIVPTVKLIVPVIGYPEIFGVPEYDLEEALYLKKEAGFENVQLKLECLVQDGDYPVKLANSLKSAWEKIGVELVIKTTDVDKYMQNIKNSNADLFTYSWLGDFADPVTFLELFRGNSSFNPSQWKDPEFDRLLDKAATMEGYKRLEELSKAEQYLLDQGMVIPISHNVAINVIDTDCIKGWYENVLNFHPLKNIYFVEEPLLPNIVKLY